MPPPVNELYRWLNAVASANIDCVVVTELTSHRDISTLNELADKNTNAIFVTELTSHRDMSALNHQLLRNIIFMVVTELTSHCDISALNRLAKENMCAMVVTELTSHRDMSAVKDPLLENRLLMLVTSDTSQSAISTVPAAPQSAPWLQHATPVGSTAMQLSTAAFSAVLSGNVHAVSTPGAGSSPAALVPPPVQGAHSPFSTRSFSGHGFWTVHSPGGPSVVSTPSPREKSASHVTAPVNIPVVFAPSAKVHALTPARRNPEAPWNIPRASVTCDIFHWLMFWSKRAAPWNIPCTPVTCDISQWPMFTLNCVLPWNRKLMSVTRETSQ